MSQRKLHMELDETMNKLLTEGVESKGPVKEQTHYREIVSTLVVWLTFVLKSGAIINCWGQSRREWRLTKASLLSVLPLHTSHFASKLILNKYLRTVNLKDHYTIALLWAPNHWSLGGSSLSPESSVYPCPKLYYHPCILTTRQQLSWFPPCPLLPISPLVYHL